MPSPLADEKATPEYEYRSTIRVVPLFNLVSINDLHGITVIKHKSHAFGTDIYYSLSKKMRI